MSIRFEDARGKECYHGIYSGRHTGTPLTLKSSSRRMLEINCTYYISRKSLTYLVYRRVRKHLRRKCRAAPRVGLGVVVFLLPECPCAIRDTDVPRRQDCMDAHGIEP